MDRHPLAGHHSVEDSAKRIRHYRYVEERLMRIMGGWIALTPELPAKLVFGRHVWDCAQHTDLWGRRLPELRALAQQSEAASDAVARTFDLVDGLTAPEQTVERLTSVYRVVKPHLVAVYEQHLAAINPIYEPPTWRILERCLDEERRHVAAGTAVLSAVAREPATRERAAAWEARLVEALTRAGGIAADGFVARVEAVTHPRAERDVVALTPPAPLTLPTELAEAVERHRRALMAGDLAAVTAQVASTAHESVTREYARLTPPFVSAEVVALARVGAHRMVKLAVHGPQASAVVQLQWRRNGEGWRIFGAEVVRVETAS